MTNPFEDPNGSYLVLMNDEGQYSLWPIFIDVPAGWTVAYPAGTREACLEYVSANWTDMRPQSLIDAMSDRDSQKLGNRCVAGAKRMKEISDDARAAREELIVKPVVGSS